LIYFLSKNTGAISDQPLFYRVTGLKMHEITTTTQLKHIQTFTTFI